MKKLKILIFCIITGVSCFGQIRTNDSLTIQEFNFFYKDSIDNIVSFGDYEPTGFVSFDDGSLIISTEFSIDFSRQNLTSDSFTLEKFNAYYEQYKKIENKTHISSGSVFKLNLNFEKKWELVFKDYRVSNIGKLPDRTIIIAGERIDMRKFWMAQIDTSGKIIWQKEFKFKFSSSVANMTIDSLGNSYILIETERIIPISINKSRGERRIKFFKPSEMENNIYLIKVSSKGNILWKKCLDKRRNFEKFGFEIFISENIFVTSSYDGFIKRKGEWIEQDGKILFELNNKGKILKMNECKDYFQYHYNDNYFSCKTDENTLILYTNDSNQYISTETIVFPSQIKSVWIYKSFTTKDFIYLLGSKDHNHGYLIVKLSKDNKYITHWNDSKTEPCELVDAIIKPDSSLIVLGRSSKEAKGTNNELITNINLTWIKKNSR